MKKIVLIFTLLLIISFQVNAQWVMQNPFPTPYNLNDGYFISPEIGWAVGDFGTLLITTDSGLSWKKQETNTHKDFTTVYFLNEDIGLIGCDNFILRTSNGGSDWEEIQVQTEHINDIIFIDDSLGYIVGGSTYRGCILRTTNRGKSWSNDILIQFTQGVYILNCVGKTDSINLFAGSSNQKFLSSTDKGYHWHVVQNNASISNQLSIAAVNNNLWITGWDYYNSDRIIKSTDGGVTFTVQLTGNYGHLLSIDFFDDNCGVAVGESGEIFTTNNGGEEWNNINLYLQENLNKVITLNGSTCIVLGDEGSIFRSTNKGMDWIKINEGTGNALNISFIDENNGWAAGPLKFLTTTNGGNEWQVKSASSNFTSIFRLNYESGFGITATDGVIWGDVYVTDDTGNTWTILTYNIPPIMDVHFIDRNTGWIAGTTEVTYPVHTVKGHIYKTTNGGISWVNQDSVFYNSYVNDIYFKDENYGWLVGNNIRMRTVDGGANWIRTTYPPYSLNSVYFIDSLTGYSVGAHDLILKSTNGGQLWTLKPAGGATSLHSIHFSSYEKGWAVGESGFICQTTDAGYSWHRINDVTTLDLYDVFFINDTVGWISGDNGIILKTGTSTPVNVTDAELNPTDFVLYQNYPNPFNPDTRIQYAIGSRQYVTLKIYDLLGREVATLVDDEKPAGKYEVIWNTSSQSSGVYFYRLQSAGFIQTRKMILLK